MILTNEQLCPGEQILSHDLLDLLALLHLLEDDGHGADETLCGDLELPVSGEEVRAGKLHHGLAERSQGQLRPQRLPVAT
eukprot:4419343-Pyramimonas_sp.AAC.4